MNTFPSSNFILVYINTVKKLYLNTFSNGRRELHMKIKLMDKNKTLKIKIKTYVLESQNNNNLKHFVFQAHIF